MHELQNGIQFETIPNSNAENGDYPSIYIAVLLGVHVFDCDVTGFIAREQCVSVIIIYILVFYCANAQKYWNMHLCNWKQHSLTIFP